MKPKLGQVFLIDFNIINKISESVGLTSDDQVLEIGCGEGILTQSLLDKAGQVTVVELDPVCIEKTKQAITQPDHVRFILQDVLTVDFSSIYDSPYRVIANIPYYLSAKLMQRFVTYRTCFQDMTIMVQKEFASKLVAKPGDKDYTSLGVYCSFYFEIDYLFTISKNSFRPVPKIDSAMIRITPRKTLPFDVDEDVFFMIVNSAFWGRRKQLVTALKKSPFIDVPKDLKLLPFFKKHPRIRGEMLSLGDFYDVYVELTLDQKNTP